jgi:hypothetical protein
MQLFQSEADRYLKNHSKKKKKKKGKKGTDLFIARA